jgi:hypothetical protein
VDDFGEPEPGTYPDHRGVARKLFARAGRFFVLWAVSGSRPVDPGDVEAAGEALRSFSVEAGEFYPGKVQPASFEQSEGWYIGSSGAGPVRADGEWTTSWAATIPYRDAWDELPMRDTLQALPEDGIVVYVALSRWWNPLAHPRWPVHPQPYQLGDFDIRPNWEGQVGQLPEYLLLTRVEGAGGYEVEVRIFFGRPDASSDMLARAQAQLDRLRLPDWGPWELE